MRIALCLSILGVILLAHGPSNAAVNKHRKPHGIVTYYFNWYSVNDSGGLTNFQGGPTLGSVCSSGQGTWYQACDANITSKSRMPMSCPVGTGSGTYGIISFDPNC
jgi:hypothetical protein